MSIVLLVQTARETLSDNIGHKSSSIAIDMKTIKEGFQFPTGCTFFRSNTSIYQNINFILKIYPHASNNYTAVVVLYYGAGLNGRLYFCRFLEKQRIFFLPFTPAQS